MKNPAAQKIFVPSLFIFLSVGASILVACALAIGGPAGGWGAGAFILAFLSLFLVYRVSLRMGPGLCHPRRSGRAARLAVLLLVTLSCALYAGGRVYGVLTECVPALGKGTWTARVESVVDGRYCREAIVRFRCEGAPGEGPCGREAWRGGIVRVPGGSFGAGDTIRFSGAPVALNARDAPRPYTAMSDLMAGVRYVFYLEARAIEVVGDAASFREKTRERLAANCDSLFNRKTAAMVKALYFGNQDYIDKLTMNDFKRAGVFHILSAGGLHVAVVAAVPIFLLGLVRVNRKVIAVAASLAVLAYLWITDMPVCLLRSCVMFCIYAAQRLADREQNVFNALFLSAAAILVLFPAEIFGLGFQLSYGATLGILLFHGRYRKILPRLPAVIANSIALTLSAQLLVLPVILLRVNELNLSGLASNIIVVPLMSLLLLVSLAAHAVSFVPAAAAYAGGFTDGVYSLADGIVRSLSAAGGHFYVAAPPPQLAAALVLLAAPLVLPPRRKRIAWLSIPAAVLAAWLSLGGPGAAGRDTVTEVRHSRGSVLLVKRGTTLSVIGRYPEKRHRERLAKEIASASCREIVLYLPHADYQDVSCCTYLLRRLPVSRCYLSGSFRLRGFIRRFFDTLERDGADLVIHDCGPSCPGDGACRLYARGAARERAPLREMKNNHTRYLTLH